MLENEKRILEIARHPFIVHLFGSFQDEKFVYFVLEYIPGGELFTHLSDSNCFSENKVGLRRDPRVPRYVEIY